MRPVWVSTSMVESNIKTCNFSLVSSYLSFWNSDFPSRLLLSKWGEGGGPVSPTVENETFLHEFELKSVFNLYVNSLLKDEWVVVNVNL